MGVVYRARHRTLGTLHALKVIGRVPLVVRKRFEREAQLQARLRHPNVVRVTDVIDVDGNPALVAEFIDGPTLDQLMARGPLERPAALALFRQVVEGVAVAHQHGIVHRDLKPQNIMVETVGGVLVPRVSDFGIAGVFSGTEGMSNLTRTGVAMGTPTYMAPEQARDAGAVDQRADIFSLGCILYELLLGQRAFLADSIVQLAVDIASENYCPPRNLDPDLPGELEALIYDCLRADPDQRMPSCEELLLRMNALECVRNAPAPTRVPAPSTPSPRRRPPAEPTLPPPVRGTKKSGEALDASWFDVRARSLAGLTRGQGRSWLALGLVVILSVGSWLALRGASRGVPAVTPTVTGPSQPAANAADVPGPVEPVADVDPSTEQVLAVPPEDGGVVAKSTTAPPASTTTVRDAASDKARTTSGNSTTTSTSPTGSAEAQGTAAEVATAEDAGTQDAAPAASTTRPSTGSASSGSTSAGRAGSGTPATRVTFSGEYFNVALVGEAGRFGTGSVPAGRYTIRASFDGSTEIDAGYISIRDGEQVEVSCDAQFEQCRRRE